MLTNLHNLDPLKKCTASRKFKHRAICTTKYTMCMVETRLGDERSVKWMNKLQDHLINPLVVSFLPYASVVIYLSIYQPFGASG